MHPCVNDANDGCLVTALVTISYVFVVVIAVFELIILFNQLLIYLFAVVFFPHSAIAGTHGNIKSQSFWFKVKIYAESFILETRIRYLNV